MIIDAHAHYTSAPPQLQAFRGTQITNYARPAKGRLNVSDEQIEQSVQYSIYALGGLIVCQSVFCSYACPTFNTVSSAKGHPPI